MPNLTGEEEAAIEAWLMKISQIGYGQKKRELKLVVNKILDEDGRTTMFPNNLPEETALIGSCSDTPRFRREVGRHWARRGLY